MLCNLHTHTTFCDGKSTAEEVVLSAIEKGFDTIGISGHASSLNGENWHVSDMDGYIKTILDLKEKYKNKIQVYLGIEDDVIKTIDRTPFDYTIGSVHYFYINGEYLSVDNTYEKQKEIIEKVNGNVLMLADNYYSMLVDFVLKTKPDIVGHFDLITKFDEVNGGIFLNNKKYCELAKKYLLEALKSDCIFEVNTGAISRGYRTNPYPSEELLFVLKNNGGKIMLNSDSHHADTLDCHFDETRKLLKDIGFTYTYILHDNEFKKDFI